MFKSVITPNFGAAVPDVIAAGHQYETREKWMARHDVDRRARITLKRLSHVRYQHPDPDEISNFLLNKETPTRSGLRAMVRINTYTSSKGPKRFLGGTFEVETEHDIERAAELPGAGPAEDMVNAPGDGQILTISDPKGFPFNLVFGQELSRSKRLPEKLPMNYEANKERIRKFERFQPRPADFHKLGNFSYCSTKFSEQLSFYISYFNIISSDCIHVTKDGKQEVVTVFAHIDLGDTVVDHHSFSLSANPTAHVHHSSFEVHDYDTQNLGHQWLAQKGYKSIWGVGRHVLGSQIFDYWWDTTGNMVEDYADGDLVSNETLIAFVEAGSESLAVWGPELSPTFLQ